MPQVDFCFTCWPGGPVIPPPCLRCGSRSAYFAAGLCTRCHPYAIPPVESCRDCYAWGVTRLHNWLCHGCSTWRAKYKIPGDCATCDRTVILGAEGVCRLCRKQATLVRTGRDKLDVTAANRHGQQLFLANMFSDGSQFQPKSPPAESRQPLRPPVQHQQLLLIPIQRNLAACGRAAMPAPPDPALADELDRHTRAYAAARRWGKKHTDEARWGVRILLGLQDTPGAPINATEVLQLRAASLRTWTVLEVLADAGLLIDDRPPTIETWFHSQIAGLPQQMTAELLTWFDVMRHGRSTSPRRRPRSETTIRLHTRWALPVLSAWAASGRTTLREITKDDVLDALPAAGNPRSTAGQGLKSIFRVLKQHKILFTDPTRRVKTGDHEARQPVPVDLDALRQALTSSDAARAAVVALIAFHGLRPGHIRRMKITDLRDGRLHVDGRVVVLAEPVLIRIKRWLDHRDARWPTTLNDHFFLHYRTACRPDAAVGHRWVRLTIGEGLTGTTIREDRILNEAHATDGDVRRLVDLFGLSVQASTRYTATVDHPGLTGRTADRDSATGRPAEPPHLISTQPPQHHPHARWRLWFPAPMTPPSSTLRAADQIAYLDQAAASDPGRQYKQQLLTALDLRPGHVVLDVGCGPGTDLPALAAAVEDRGAVIGIDHDPAMLEQAQQRTAAHTNITVRAGDAHALPLENASIDRARTDRVLQHLTDPRQALAELRRVVRPGGLVALAEPDWDTLAIDSTDTATSRAYTHYVTSKVVRNAAIGRQLGRLLNDVGFEVASIEATVATFHDYQAAEAILRMPAVAQRAWQSGALDENTARTWLTSLTNGPFLAAFTFFTAIGRVPTTNS
ncbi:methyltransferase domain-containing protein [Micromonospora zamorensis]|uniref:Methyltransferase domain-containing protein n=1 Tax=Micromonospora zamorensis TaxID=709883 RepID=A0ABZ1PQU6_9ACTN